MNTKPISPKSHALIDYAMVGSLLVVPYVLGFSKKVKTIYAMEALPLLAYIALTDQPASLKPLIPFSVHGKIDPVNMAQFAVQTFFKPFQKDRSARLFNIGFTVLTGISVLLTDWNGRTKRNA